MRWRADLRRLAAAVVVLFVVCAVVSCRCGAGAEKRWGEKAADEELSPDITPDQVELSWRRHRLADIGLELEVLNGPALSEGSAGGIEYAIQEDRGVRLRVASSPDSDLASWRGSYAARGATFGGVDRLTVCGAPAKRQVAEIAPESATGILRGPDGSVGHVSADKPAVFAVAVAFAIVGRPVLVEWVVPATERARYRAAEKRFLGSLSCP